MRFLTLVICATLSVWLIGCGTHTNQDNTTPIEQQQLVQVVEPEPLPTESVQSGECFEVTIPTYWGVDRSRLVEATIQDTVVPTVIAMMHDTCGRSIEVVYPHNSRELALQLYRNRILEYMEAQEELEDYDNRPEDLEIVRSIENSDMIELPEVNGIAMAWRLTTTNGQSSRIVMMMFQINPNNPNGFLVVNVQLEPGDPDELPLHIIPVLQTLRWTCN